MYVLGKRWRDGYLDYHRAAGQLRLRVQVWWPLGTLTDLYLEQPRNLRRVWNYIREIGLKSTIRKVRSRLSESLRDRRVIAAGIGEVIEADSGGAMPVGSQVVFIAPNHPLCVERVVLPAALIAPVGEEAVSVPAVGDGVRLQRSVTPSTPMPDLTQLAGWSAFSGVGVDGSADVILEWARRELSGFDLSAAELLPIPTRSPIKERTSVAIQPRSHKGAVLFGLGNYAKTCILPQVVRRIRVRAIHEVDPAQIGRPVHRRVSYDTAPSLRDDEHYDVCFIAGFHHTHAPLAVQALRRGSWVVCEKPLVTTRGQLSRLLSALGEHPGRYFAGFHMRYSRLWELARRDLARAGEHPVHYQCIVFEVPLPRRHWYNWPASGSRIISNACHWLDHFLYLNGFAAPRHQQVWRAGSGDLHISVELVNGAVLSMVLTDIGSQRVGMRDHVELRAGEVTVRVEDGRRYVSEDRLRILNRRRANRQTSYSRMYRNISRSIVSGGGADTIESVQRSCELMLSLEEEVASQ